MGEELLQWDYHTFELVNQLWISPFLDALMPVLRNKFFWVPLYAFIISFLVINFRKQGVILVVMLIITVAAADQLTSQVIKPYVGRSRPCQDVSLAGDVRMLIDCGPGKSFPSAHAANHFAVAGFLLVALMRIARWAGPFFLLWAAAISYAQVYVGVHFPIDVISGMIVGLTLGIWIGYLARGITGPLLTQTVHLNR